MTNTCFVPGCDRPPYFNKGYCKVHRARVKKYGDPQAHIPIRPDGQTVKINVDAEGNRYVCSEECDKPAITAGLCSRHYQQKRRAGLQKKKRTGAVDLSHLVNA